MTERDAFNYVDWNVMAILVGSGSIAGYFGKTRAELAFDTALKLSGGGPACWFIMTFLAGFISMFGRQRGDDPDEGAGGASPHPRIEAAVGPVILMIGSARTSWVPRSSSATCRRRLLHSVAGRILRLQSGSSAAHRRFRF